MSINYYEENNIGFIEFNQDDSKVNILTVQALQELTLIVARLHKAAALKAVVFISKKSDVFIAGADIKEIEGINDPSNGEAKSKAGQEIFNAIEDLKPPTIAVIDGVALGGGCELALACQYRLATFNPKARIGLPEVTLGILPGFGGTYRLPRLIGLPEGLKMILGGKPVDTPKALRLGLVDRLVTSNGLERHLNEFIDDVCNKKIPVDKYSRRTIKGLAVFQEKSFIGQRIVFQRATQDVLKTTKGFYPAPLKALHVIRQNFYMNDRAKGLALESQAFGQLATTAISKNLIRVFYLAEKYRKLGVPDTEGLVSKAMTKCGIVGAGVMGGGIAQLFSYMDIWVRLKDIHYDALALGLKSAAKLYRDAVKRRRLKAHEAIVKMGKIASTIDYTGFRNTDIVIEAVVEDMDIKRKVFRELNSCVNEQTILATNTSALSVSELAKITKDPSKVIGLHFFNPVHKMPLVEVITTPQTSKETLASVLALVKRLGKTPILVKDSCGFLVNRILLGYLNEAGRIWEEGADIATIDKIMTDFGMPMGPLTLCDEIGLDIGIKVLRILADGLGERFKPVAIFEKAYTEGFLGKKSGKGFYLLDRRSLVKTKQSNLLNTTECLQRMVYPMINEAARCLEERIVDDPGAVDVGMIFGTGFPAFRGGLLRYADSLGISHIVAGLRQLQDKWRAARFAPANYLIKLHNEQRGFYS